MKKIILILAVTLCIAISGKAQDESKDIRSRFMLGLKAGANLSNVYDSEGENFTANSKFGLATGVFVCVPIGKYFGIQPEALFSQKGFQATGVLLGNTYNITRTTSYLDLPLFASFKPARFITLLAGPQFSYLLKQRDEFANTTTTIVQEREFENDNVRKNVLCFVHGIDFNFNHIVFGSRLGIDVQNNNGDGTSTTPRYKNIWFQGTIGYRLY